MGQYVTHNLKIPKGFRLLIILGAVTAIDCAVSHGAVRQGKFGFLKGTTSMLSSLAQDLVMRSGTSSQVLSLNLTNLFILLVIKAIVFGAGSFGYGYGTGTYGRSVDDHTNEDKNKTIDWNDIITESELLMMLGFMKGDATQDYGCLQRAVCQEPRKAEEYSFTGKLFLKGYELLGGLNNISRYENALAYIDEAILQGLNGRNCLDNFRCEVS